MQGGFQQSRKYNSRKALEGGAIKQMYRLRKCILNLKTPIDSPSPLMVEKLCWLHIYRATRSAEILLSELCFQQILEQINRRGSCFIRF